MILDRLKKGEAADIVILTGPVIDELTKQGKVVPGSRVDIASTGLGVAIRAGAPKPDISSTDAFKRTLLNAESVAYTATGASGVYFAGHRRQGRSRIGRADDQRDHGRPRSRSRRSAAA